MVAVITAALVTLYSAATAEGEAIVRRIHNATIALVTLDSQMLGRSVPASVPEAMYCECKSLYMMLRCPLAAVVSPPLVDPPRGRATSRCRGRRPRPGELRQEDVSAVFGVTRQTVVRWEDTQTVDGPDNTSNPWGYYRSLRTNPELRGSFEMLANMARAYLSARARAKCQGQRFRMSFVRFKEDWLRHNAAGKM